MIKTKIAVVTGPNAVRTVAERADTAVWLAALPDGDASGGFYRDGKAIAW